MREQNRGPWYLLTGLVIGVAFGILYSWVISPVRYVDTMPKSLRPDFKDQYRALIAAAYAATGDLERARARLDLLADEDVSLIISLQAQDAIAAGHPEAEIRALSLLSVALKEGTSMITALPATSTMTPLPPSQTPTHTPSPTLENTIQPTDAATSLSTSRPARTSTITPRATYTPTASFTPLPTRTPTATPGSAYILEEQALICEIELAQPLVQVFAEDAAGNAVPGVEFVVTWGANEEHFFTGLKPEMGLGYADFVMTPGITYILRMADGVALAELKPTECEVSAGLRTWGIWKLTFVQP
jgi:hypothetical protein